MIDPSRVVYCVGVDGQSCGRYSTAANLLKLEPDKQWSMTPDGIMCPHCVRRRVKSRARATLGAGVPTLARTMTDREREAAREALPQDLLEAVDKAWGEV